MKTTKTTDGSLQRLVDSLGGLSRSTNEIRHCSRCHDRLTDPASWERGIGPVCAKKDTHLFAKTIPANFPMATMNAMSVNVELLAETVRPVWRSVIELLTFKSSRALAAANLDTLVFHASGEDCRLIVKVIDWMLSFETRGDQKNLLIQTVKNLGYPGLAGVLAGQSSTGEAVLAFDALTGKLSLKGSSNKAGFLAMRKIPGIVVPRYRSQGVYEAPASQHEKFIAAVMEFWPCFSGEVSAITAACVAWCAAHPVKVAAQVKATQVDSRPKARVVTQANSIVVSFAWDKSFTPRVVEDIKTINWKERSYNPNDRTWKVNLAHKDKVLGILKAHYAVEEVSGDSTTATPVAASYKPYRGSYGRSGRNCNNRAY